MPNRPSRRRPIAAAAPAILVGKNDHVDQAEILLLEAKASGAQVLTAADFPVENFFAPGLYARMLSRKAGTTIIGHAHRHAHLSILLKGRLRVFRDGNVCEIVGPSKPWLTVAGIRKATYAVEDSVLITFHPTNETDEARLEAELIEKSPAFQKYEEQQAAHLLKLANEPQIQQGMIPG